ncbi:hypothetical protein A9Q84_20600 [Halobacteriovorax marinus]|uniref:Glycosyltransferase RgtA/B/C/D-like domain-containing protein n=1 Tax=Halobacteriovorax marinus TaxID=97084 RepID=A0A1Y5F7Q6_9BACT|nr:hypothetical protein A9Q84_20600 [Halobacteriovorax marinus]
MFVHNTVKKLTYFSIFLIFILYSWDIGNVDAIRQGTEGFYLKVAKEMFESGNILVPQYVGADHWSKPPLQFWAAYLGYFIGGGPSIFISRLIVVLFTLFSLVITSRLISKSISKPFILVFVFIASTFGMFKYSRIFMMEVPLTMLTTLASLYFYEYLKDKKHALILSSLFLGLSVLIKGPVSIVMSVGGCGLYLLFTWKRYGFNSKDLKKIFSWSVVGTAIASVWFIICFMKYGYIFFDYFFLRENLGKFSTKSYPMRHVFQGLLIFSLPWSLYLPTSISQIKDHLNKIKDDDYLVFCICNFITFFFLWLIPSQRSHHYAMPSMIFFLVINFILLNKYELSQKRKKMMKLANIAISIIMFLVATLLCSLLVFEDVQASYSLIIKVITTICLLLFGSVLFLKSKKTLSQYFISLFIIGNLWNILIPSFILPYLPKEVITKIGDRKVAAAVRKPYFIEEALGRKVEWLDGGKLEQYVIENNHYYIMHKSTFETLKLQRLTKVVSSWRIWRRGIKANEVISALKLKNINKLKDTVYLLENKPLK